MIRRIYRERERLVDEKFYLRQAKEVRNKSRRQMIRETSKAHVTLRIISPPSAKSWSEIPILGDIDSDIEI
jgi:hypothetical protein